MDDLVRRSDVKEYLKRVIFGADWKIDSWVDAIPAVDAVERGVYEQVAWERDTALAQLSDIGKGLGAKMDDVAKVVRCRECWAYGTDNERAKSEGLNPAEYCVLMRCEYPSDGYCSYGRRIEGGDK